MEEDMPIDYFKHQKVFLGFLGISLDHKKRSIPYKIYSIFVAIVMFISYGILETMEAFYNFENESVFISICSYLATDLLGLVKHFILLYYRKEIADMLGSFESGVFKPNIQRGGIYEVKLVKKYITISDRQGYLYQFFCMCVILLGIFGSMMDRVLNPHDKTKWNMPFLPFSLVDIKKSPNFELSWFYQGFLRIFYCMIVSTTDALLGAILAHISAQCLLLQNSIKMMIDNAYKDMLEKTPGNAANFVSSEKIDASLIPFDILDVYLKKTVHYHWAILNLAEKFEKIFSTLILFEFFATLCILCFSMYHASTFSLFSRQAGQDFSYVAAISVQVFLCCFWGNEVTVQSQAIAEACSETNYVGTNLHFQKGLAFIIRRCQTPVVLTAAKFTDLSLKTYMWIIRASYSYYMVLRSRNKDVDKAVKL